MLGVISVAQPARAMAASPADRGRSHLAMARRAAAIEFGARQVKHKIWENRWVTIGLVPLPGIIAENRQAMRISRAILYVNVYFAISKLT
jgi:hypothetical protein